ncbi:MAG: hypothetical protein IPJ17_10645 [Holophagales bacterium]|nr:MAG: hypothetical protein IPJ17_10645 [Holophagales bacterium]
MNFTESQDRATGELVELVASCLGAERAIHPETAIASTARLAGSLLLRSFGLPLGKLEPGSVVLSDAANEKGPMLVEILAAYLAGAEVPIQRDQLGGEPARRGAQPHLSTVQSLAQLQDEAMAIAERHGLTLEQLAQSAALATAFLVRECAPRIGAETGFNIATYGFVEGSKTVPPRSSRPGSGPVPAAARPWYKFW